MGGKAGGEEATGVMKASLLSTPSSPHVRHPSTILSLVPTQHFAMSGHHTDHSLLTCHSLNNTIPALCPHQNLKSLSSLNTLTPLFISCLRGLFLITRLGIPVLSSWISLCPFLLHLLTKFSYLLCPLLMRCTESLEHTKPYTSGLSDFKIWSLSWLSNS